jgi:hypothetical protein
VIGQHCQTELQSLTELTHQVLQSSQCATKVAKLFDSANVHPHSDEGETPTAMELVQQ